MLSFEADQMRHQINPIDDGRSRADVVGMTAFAVDQPLPFLQKEAEGTHPERKRLFRWQQMKLSALGGRLVLGAIFVPALGHGAVAINGKPNVAIYSPTSFDGTACSRNNVTDSPSLIASTPSP